MAVAFVLTWLIPEKPLRKTVETGPVGDELGGPVDTDSVREITREISRAVGRERTLAFMAGMLEHAGIDLSPGASWALMRLGAPEAPTVADLAAAPHVRSDRLAAAMGELRDDGLVAGERVTEAGWSCASGSSSPARVPARAGRRLGARPLPGARPAAAAPGRRARARPGLSRLPPGSASAASTSRTKGSTAGHCASSTVRRSRRRCGTRARR